MGGRDDNPLLAYSSSNRRWLNSVFRLLVGAGLCRAAAFAIRSSGQHGIALSLDHLLLDRSTKLHRDFCYAIVHTRSARKISTPSSVHRIGLVSGLHSSHLLAAGFHKLARCHILQRAVGPELVVVPAPCLDLLSSIVDRQEPTAR